MDLIELVNMARNVADRIKAINAELTAGHVRETGVRVITGTVTETGVRVIVTGPLARAESLSTA